MFPKTTSSKDGGAGPSRGQEGKMAQTRRDAPKTKKEKDFEKKDSLDHAGPSRLHADIASGAQQTPSLALPKASLTIKTNRLPGVPQRKVASANNRLDQAQSQKRPRRADELQAEAELLEEARLRRPPSPLKFNGCEIGRMYRGGEQLLTNPPYWQEKNLNDHITKHGLCGLATVEAFIETSQRSQSQITSISCPGYIDPQEHRIRRLMPIPGQPHSLSRYFSAAAPRGAMVSFHSRRNGEARFIKAQSVAQLEAESLAAAEKDAIEAKKRQRKDRRER